ncbi:MAG: UDP-N-acetyl-D-glucosamine dehydrogenase [Phycisphaeraceae bacterium]|nr:UDP-N-acetyl-D-glucosamine dehydrogenase [Phycisphaeraceae bacterium]|tara:strand:- start:1326 stop:2639 length:1314 start_codon:yes stop_codon:yes gene_type:complete
MSQLAKKIDDRTALIGVKALGYVGLPLSRAFCDAGFKVLGFDIDTEKVDALNQGRNYLKHLGTNFVADMVNDGSFSATADSDRLVEPDAILVCVPTPLDTHLQPDLGFMQQAAKDIAKTLRVDQLVVLESTTYPGSTRQIMLPPLEARSLTCGKDFYLAYSPEREDPGRNDCSTRQIPKLVGGIDPESGRLATHLYRCAIDQVIETSSAEVAESAKLLENIYRAVNIAMVNEMKVVLTQLGIDTNEVVDAAATKPFGFSPFYPGPGLGGHCIPIDPYYLTWKAREVGMPTRFIELAGEVNRSMPQYVVDRAVLALNQRGKPIRSAKVLVLGLAYKPDVDDIRESPSFELIKKLSALDANVAYHDPHVPATHRMRHYNLQMTSIELSPAILKEYDCVVIATHHSAYDWQMIADNCQLIIDTRGVMRDVTGTHDHIVMA